MESLDLEEVDKEMAMDEAAQSSAPNGDAPEPATDAPTGEDAAANAWIYYLENFSFVYFWWMLVLFWAFFFFCKSNSGTINFILKTMFAAQWLWVFNEAYLLV